MKMECYSSEWSLDVNDTITYIVERFYHCFGAKISKSSVCGIEVCDLVYKGKDFSAFLYPFIKFKVRACDIGCVFSYTLDTTSGIIEKG